MEPTFNILLIGDNKVGKTTFVEKCKSGRYVKQYYHTSECVTTHLEFHTNKGLAVVYVTECDLGTPIPDMDFQAVIIMFSVTSMKSYKAIASSEVYNTCKSISPNMILCGNKVDCKREVGEGVHRSMFKCDRKMPYVEISAKNDYNFEKLFIRVLRPLMGFDTVFAGRSE